LLQVNNPYNQVNATQQMPYQNNAPNMMPNQIPYQVPVQIPYPIQGMQFNKKFLSLGMNPI